MDNRLNFIILFLLSAFNISVLADNVNISGRVRDNDNKPLEFVTVKLPGTAIGTFTDLKGNYSLSVAQQDTIKLEFSCLGFKTITRQLINPVGNVSLNVKMYPQEKSLKEVEVTGFRGNVNGMQTLNVDSYRNSPDVSGGSIESMLTTMPGVNSSNELSSQYSVRGGSFDENSVYINGVEIYRPQLISSGQQEGLSIINPDMVGNIRFSSGGFPARYGDKMSSSLDIVYREPQCFEAGITVGLMGASLYLGQNSGKFSQLHGVRYRKNNSLLSSQETKGEYNPSYFDYQTNLRLKTSDKFSIDFLGNVSLNRFAFIPTDRETAFGTSSDLKRFKVYFDGHEKDKFETLLGSLSFNYRKNPSSTLSLNLSAFTTNELVSYDISGEYWLDKAGSGNNLGDSQIGGEQGIGKYMEHARDRLKATVLSASLNGAMPLGKTRLSYGLSYSHQKFRDRSREWEWRDSAGYSLPTAPPGVNVVYNLSSNHDLSVNRLAFYAEDAVSFETAAAYMTLNAGVRLSYWDFNKEFLVSPRVNFNISPASNNNWTFRLATGLYYQSPFFKEYRETVIDDLGNASIKLNDNIKSPRSLQFILGTDYVFRAFDRPFKITAEAYYKNLANLISYEYDNLKVTYSGQNDSKGHILGLDFKLFGQFVAGSDSWISFSLMNTRQTLHGKKVPLPSDQRYSLGLYFTDYFPKFPKLKFSLRGVISDGLTHTPPRVNRADAFFRSPSYKRVDIGLSYDLVSPPQEGEPREGAFRHFKRITVGADVFNLFDISNVSSYYWVTDVNNLQYAVPNYLTRRQLNFNLTFEF